MSSFELQVWDDETERVTFYSPKVDGAALCEMDRFLERMEAMPAMELPLQELLELIRETIGNTYGAIETFFNRF